ncbi:MAG: glycosyltransferase family 39 protein [Bacteroidales bacterium]|nr:glycosyltransferase family 39 protein [Bacteroidales bacterium]
MNQTKQHAIAVLIILSLGILFHYKYINEFPSYIHAWAQSDRYALALGFKNNNLNFFKPETFVLNHQFPDDWKVPSESSITAVDFPVHEFIPAVIMKIFGITAPWIFRLYILLYSFSGLFFLFKLAFLFSDNFYKSIFVMLFAATSPVFVYYQGGFLPTIPSMANVFIGIYFYFKYIHYKKNKYFNICILFLTLASLSRTTFAIPLLAVFGFEILRIFKNETVVKPIIIYTGARLYRVPILPVLSILSVLGYFLYNISLRNRYGSIFLSSFLPPQSIQQVVEIFKLVIKNWGFQYFSAVHYLVFFLLIFISLFFIFSKKERIQSLLLQLLVLTSIILAGCFLFAFLMLRQFPAHDYYFLDTFYLPVILLLIVMVTRIPLFENKRNTIIYSFGILLVTIPMIVITIHTQKNRRISGSWDKATATIQNFTGSEQLLDSLQISTDARMLVIDACAPNIPFILMNRKGFAVMSTKKETIKDALAWKYDYIIMQNEIFLSDIYSSYPEILSKIVKIADNEKISVCVLSDSLKNQSLMGFLGLEGKSPVFRSIMNYDTVVSDYWQNTQSTSEVYFNGTKSGQLIPEMLYGLTYKTKNLQEITTGKRYLLFSSYFLQDTIKNCEIVLTINENGQNTYYKSYNLRNLLKEKNSWEKVNLLFRIPRVKSRDYEFALYLWNTGHSELYLDDFGFELF